MSVTITVANRLRINRAELAATQEQAIRDALTIPNPAYVQAEKFGRSTWRIPSVLEFFDLEPDSMFLPRGFAHRLPDLLPGIRWNDQRLTLPETPFTFSGQLRDYQTAAVNAVLARQQGVLQAGTGAGKTVMALAIIAARKQPALVLVHNTELLNQWRDRSAQFLGVEAGRIGGGRFEVRPLTVGIVNTVRNRLDDLTAQFGHIVVDECHRCPSAMFTECVDAFPAAYRLGLSATPYRRDGLTKAIEFYIGPKLHEVDPDLLRDTGAILKPEIVARQTGYHFGGNAAEHYAEMMAELVQDQARNELIARDVVADLTRGAGIALVVSDRVAHLEALSALLSVSGIHMELLTGKATKTQREAIVERIRGGQVQALGSTVQLIGEGFDCPGLASLFLATPIKFSGRLLQVVGRVLRPQAGKVPCVYDYVDPVGVLQASAKARARVYGRIAA